MNAHRLSSIAVIALLASAGAASADLITNGNFSAGNTGFTSAYSYVTNAGPGTPNIFNELTYGIAGPGTDTIHPNWTDFADHTGDTAARFMIVNGSSRNGGNYAWSQVVNAGANGGTYQLSAWFAALVSSNRSGLEFRVYDSASALVAQSNPAFSSPTPNGVWAQQSLVFNMLANTNYTVQIWDTSGIASGNDYAIDDISLTVVPLPPAAFAGIASLAGVGVFGAIRRKRLARD